MSRVAKQPLDPDAVAAANEALAVKTGGRPLGMSPEDASLRANWMDEYLAAGGEVDDEDWGDGPTDEPVEECPYANQEPKDEKHAWFFSA